MQKKLNKMSPEELEQLSYPQIGALYLEEHKTTMTTADLFHQVCDLLQLDDSDYQDNITDFFQSLTTSKDFILLNDGKWDLRKNHKVKVEIDEIYEEKDDDIDLDSDDIDELEEMNDDYDINLDDDDLGADDDLADLTIVDDDDLEDE